MRMAGDVGVPRSPAFSLGLLHAVVSKTKLIRFMRYSGQMVSVIIVDREAREGHFSALKHKWYQMC